MFQQGFFQVVLWYRCFVQFCLHFFSVTVGTQLLWLCWWFVRFACFIGDAIRQGVSKSSQRRSHSYHCNMGLQCKGWKIWMVLILLFRVWEAANPGPKSHRAETWSFGTFNPCGLTSKYDQVSHLPGQVWVASETHLTKHGVDQVVHANSAVPLTLELFQEF